MTNWLWMFLMLKWECKRTLTSFQCFSQTGRKSVTPSSRLVPSSNSADGFQGSYEHFATSSSSEALHSASAAVGSFRMENNGHSQSFISSGIFFYSGSSFCFTPTYKKARLRVRVHFSTVTKSVISRDTVISVLFCNVT